MVKRLDVAVEEIDGASEALFDIVDIYRNEARIEKDAQEYELTPQEIIELRDAYIYEEEMGVLAQRGREFMEKALKKPIRSSEEILAAAKRRKDARFIDRMIENLKNRFSSHHGFYIWRTASDEKVRADHAAREGQIFSWSEPPEGGHPGEHYNCRCWAEPVIWNR